MTGTVACRIAAPCLLPATACAADFPAMARQAVPPPASPARRQRCRLARAKPPAKIVTSNATAPKSIMTAIRCSPHTRPRGTEAPAYRSPGRTIPGCRSPHTTPPGHCRSLLPGPRRPDPMAPRGVQQRRQTPRLHRPSRRQRCLGADRSPERPQDPANTRGAEIIKCNEHVAPLPPDAKVGNLAPRQHPVSQQGSLGGAVRVNDQPAGTQRLNRINHQRHQGDEHAQSAPVQGIRTARKTHPDANGQTDH